MAYKPARPLSSRDMARLAVMLRRCENCGACTLNIATLRAMTPSPETPGVAQVVRLAG